MTPELKAQITQCYTGWATNWGLSLAFAVTNSADAAETAIAEAVVALIASDTEFENLRSRGGFRGLGAEVQKGEKPAPKDPTRAPNKMPEAVNPVRFAGAVWEATRHEAFHGASKDSFFRLAPVSRAAAVLKTRGRFSIAQIAMALRLRPQDVDAHLESARLVFSNGRPWIERAPGLDLIQEGFGARWVPECPEWASPQGEPEPERIQKLFARYAGHDLESERDRSFHDHLSVCTTCRTGFTQFRTNWTQWENSVPALNAGSDIQKYLTDVTTMALTVDRNAGPSAWPGIQKVLRDPYIQLFLIGTIVVSAAKAFLHLWTG